MELDIHFESKELLAVTKPAGMPVQPDKTGDKSLLEALSDYTGKELGLLHRLDRPVGGVMLFAKTKEAESKLAKDLQAGTLQKTYLAVLTGKLPKEHDTVTDLLFKNARTNLSEVVSANRKGAKKAVLEYDRLAEKETENGILTLAKITLHTGRHHQIRVQTAHLNTPIWGDRKYNKDFPKRERGNIALWSYRLTGKDPKTGKPFTFSALPKEKPFSLFERELSEL